MPTRAYLIGETSFSRRNLRRRLLQQRHNGFLFEQNESLEVLRQNLANVGTLLSSLAGIPPEYVGVNPEQERCQLQPFTFARRTFKVGQWVDARDTIDQWLEAQIIGIRGAQAFIHYNGWGRRWDEWIDMNSPRLALFRTHTVQSSSALFLSPTPNTAPDGDIQGPPIPSPDQMELIGETTMQLSRVAAMMREYHILKTSPINGKEEPRNKEFIDFNNTLNVMIEEHKKAQQDKTPFHENDGLSIKSHRSLEVDNLSVKSIRSCVSNLLHAGNQLNANRAAYISEEISQEEQDEDDLAEEEEMMPPKPNPSKELRASILAAQLAPLLDRCGRLLVDIAPHFALLGGSIQSNMNQAAGNVSNLSNISIITNESGAQANNRMYSFQVPVMLNPGEVIAANNAGSRLGSDGPSYDFYIHAIVAPIQSNAGGAGSNQQSNPPGLVEPNPPNIPFVDPLPQTFRNETISRQMEPEVQNRSIEHSEQTPEESIFAELNHAEPRGRTSIDSLRREIIVEEEARNRNCEEGEDEEEDEEEEIFEDMRDMQESEIANDEFDHANSRGQQGSSQQQNYHESRNFSDCSRNIS
eukprot:TRINITY_DN641_c0_g1_i2.p1 TRINITY_DN641_c0_g1~~TRINITY_DN641_c0_g1_i2.p1  ORF type:complete len:582 (-),score=104.02 TRINITY_DN641_c0_g1_i2:74-1819(-)